MLNKRHITLFLKGFACYLVFGNLLQWFIIGVSDSPGTMEEFARRTKILDRRDVELGRPLNLTLATVACGNIKLVRNMLKTSILFSLDANLHIVIFTDEVTLPDLEKALRSLRIQAKNTWPDYPGSKFTYKMKLVMFPKYEVAGVDWASMHLPCTNQRLFFPYVLPDVDAIIYLDTDVLVFGSLTEMWREFSKMSNEQVAGATQNGEFLHASMYNKKKGHPYFGPRGLNAGIMLMNLTRMREHRIMERSMEVYKNYKSFIEFADQDILNIVFSQTPILTLQGQMYTLSCIFNFFWVHCPWKSKENEGRNVCRWSNSEEPLCFCHDIYSQGLYIIHGNFGSFLFEVEDTTKSMFKWIYSILKNYRFGDSLDDLLMRIATEYDEHQCFMTNHQLIQNALDYFTRLSLF